MYNVQSYNVQSYNVQSYNVQSYNVQSYNVQSYNVQSYNVQSYNVQSYNVQSQHIHVFFVVLFTCISNIFIKVQPMSVLHADPMADVFFGTSADVRSDVFSRHKQCPQKRKLVLTYH